MQNALCMVLSSMELAYVMRNGEEKCAISQGALVILDLIVVDMVNAIVLHMNVLVIVDGLVRGVRYQIVQEIQIAMIEAIAM